MKLSEIADEIQKHLNKLEPSPTSKPPRDNAQKVPKIYKPNCYSRGRFVYIKYVSYHSAWPLAKDEAIKYLNALENGFKGKHWQNPN